MNPYLFIVGCPRSGTTLLRRMIDVHPAIAIPSAEQHWIGQLPQRRNGVSLEGVVTHELFSSLLEDRRFAALGVTESELQEAMPRFHEGRTQTKPGLSPKKAWLPPTPGLRDWRTQMPAEEIERFEAAAGDLLDELGYPHSCSRLQPKTLEQAALIRNLFTQDLRARGCALPTGLR